MTPLNICIDCAYYRGEKECYSYSRIPDDIWLGGQHDTVRKDQKNKVTYISFSEVNSGVLPPPV